MDTLKTEGNAKVDPKMQWYDSQWLQAYRETQQKCADQCPEKLISFENAMDVFKVREDFRALKLPQPVFDEQRLERCRKIVSEIPKEAFLTHEFLSFGRYLLRHHPYFDEIQGEYVDLVSELAGEEVEPSYNFLSLYHNLGVCPPHLDAPSAKWTLDICIDQTFEWPIHVSEPIEWPELGYDADPNWTEKLSDHHSFKPHTMKPGEAILFTGTNQWHYRDRITTKRGQANSATYVFFHFIPKGSKAKVNPNNWKDMFDFPFNTRSSRKLDR